MSWRGVVWYGGRVPYEFAIIYYKDAGDSKTVWLRDHGEEPVQIATWPKRVDLFSPQTATDAGVATQGFVGFPGGESFSLDDARATQDEFGSYKYTVDIQVSLDSGTSSIQSQFAGSIVDVAGFSGGFYNSSGLYGLPNPSDINAGSVALFSVYDSSPGSSWQAAFPSISNSYGVVSVVKAPDKTLFSLADLPAVSSSQLPAFKRTGRITYGTVSSIASVTYPTAPTYDPDFGTGGGLSFDYAAGSSVWTANRGPTVAQATDTFAYADLIGTAFGTATVFNYATGITTTGVPVQGIESGAEKIIAIVALAI